MQLLLVGVVTGLAVLASCTLRETHQRCHTSNDCSFGQQCYLEYCVMGDAGEPADARTRAPEQSQPSGQATSAATEVPSKCEAVSAVSAQEGACCVESAMCYDGPAGTLGVGACKSGSRACVDGKFATCGDSVVPRAEACNNQGSDDDCNGTVDDIKGRGDSCTRMSGFGPCGEGRLDCVDGKEELSCVATESGADVEACNDQDDDCDGQIDEEFDVSSDSAHCGSCGHACASSELCCGGSCVAMSAAAASGCPSCSTQHPCAQTASCCGGACRDLEHDRRHCGACGHSCEQAQRCCDGECKADCN